MIDAKEARIGQTSWNFSINDCIIAHSSVLNDYVVQVIFHDLWIIVVKFVMQWAIQYVRRRLFGLLCRR
jgi:hypothetical protein